MLSGTNLTSPRTEIPCNPMSASMQAQTGLLHEAGPVGLPGNGDAAIIIGRHKLLMYNVTQSLWQSPNYPNGTVIDTYDWKYVVECTTPTKPACLFDIISVRRQTASRFGPACRLNLNLRVYPGPARDDGPGRVAARAAAAAAQALGRGRGDGVRPGSRPARPARVRGGDRALGRLLRALHGPAQRLVGGVSAANGNGSGVCCARANYTP